MPAPLPGTPSVEALLAHASSALQAIAASPRQEAGWLLTHVTGLSRSVVHASPETVLGPGPVAAFLELVERRRQGEPLAYLIGTQPFRSLELAVSPAVLVPRPETELVVERVLHHVPADRAAAVLDLGTGSGAIALAVAAERPQATVSATDVSAAALEVARSNARRLGLDRVELHQGSWFEPVAGRRFAVVAGNPPYVADDDPHLASEVRRHEPAVALFAGDAGLAALRHIAFEAPSHLEAGGWLVVEHGWLQGASVRALLEQAGFRHVRSHADPAGHDRVTEGQWRSVAGPGREYRIVDRG